MKRHLALAWLLLGLALMLIPFAVFLNTSASDAISDLVIHTGTPIAPTAIRAAPSATFTVTNTNDTGLGSLRAAIDQANTTPGTDLIDFNLGAGTPTINVGAVTNAPLPNITEAVTINGNTGGANRVELNGAAAGAAADGLVILSTGVTVQGLVINRFSGSGISVQGDGNFVKGNFIGTNATGTVPLPNVQGGVAIRGMGNTIGGAPAAARNVISGNNSFGVGLSGVQASNNNVQGNFIGTDASGTAPLGNNGNGVVLFGGASNNTIGGALPGAGNTIAFNNGIDGVLVFAGTGNAVLSNSIFSNAGLGIDISDDGVITPNDVCDGDAGANGLQNFPVLTSANSGGGSTTIVGTLNSTPGTTFRIEFFSSTACDPSGNGEGQTFIGFTTVATPPAVCDAPINVTLPVAVTVGNVITATATDPSNNTSEFSQCVTVMPAAVCTITCPPNQMKSNDPNQCGAVVTYPPPTTSGPCGTVTCAPASGSFFPTGTTVVTCNTAAGPSCVFNVTVNDTQPPTITCPSNVMTTTSNPGGTVVSYTAPVGTDNCPGPTTTQTAGLPSGSTFPIGTTTNTFRVTDTSGNNAMCTFTVTVTLVPCTITCPGNVSRFNDANQCGAVVTYPNPIPNGSCGPVTCSPGTGAFFPVGTTVVTCTAAGGPSCTFNVTVEDNTPPRVFCPPNISTATLPGQSTAVVNYPAATATDNCTGASVECSPPSGSRFPVGFTLVTCTATDLSSNTASCIFAITVTDSEPPVIRCPANVRVDPPQGQTSAVVSYPPPVVTDNVPGASFVCSPPSGSTFPLCVTTVTCTATDLSGNKATCAFTVTVTRPGPQLALTLEGGKSPLDFPVTAATRKPSKDPTVRTVTIQNLGCAQVSLFLGPVVRVGPDVDSGRILATRTVDSFFTVTLVNTDGSERPVDCEVECPVRIDPNQSATLRVRFNPTIPGLAGKTGGIAASEALPNNVTSRFGVAQNLSVDLLGRIATPLQLMNANNPRKPPRIGFTRSGNEFTVSYAIYDSNLDVSRAKYEFLDSSGHVVGQAIEVDLAQPLGALNLVRGQSFSVDQRFTGASSNPDVIGVRLTVFDGETSVSASASASPTSISAASIQLMNRTRRVTLYLPDVKLSPRLP